MQSPSQRQCEFMSAGSRAVTKQGLFDCETVFTYTSVCERKQVRNGGSDSAISY